MTGGWRRKVGMNTATTLVMLLEFRFEWDSEKIAYVFLPGNGGAEQSLTYGDLATRCNGITRLLSESTKPGDRVLLLHPPGLAFIAAFLGCIRAGRVAVPVGTVKPNRPGNHLEAIRANCSPSAVLAQRAYYDGVIRNAWVQQSLGDLPVLFSDEADGSAAPFAATPETLAFLQYTSGSTREPRGVKVSHANLMANMRLIRESFALDEHTRNLTWLPFFHDMGLIGSQLQPLDQANPSLLMPPLHFLSEPIRWLREISRFKATVSGGPNFAYDLCVDRTTEADRQGLDLSSWKTAFNGSEPVSARTLRRFVEAFEPYGFRREAFYPCYGMAESTLFVSGKTQGTSNHFIATTRTALAEGKPLQSPGEIELVSCGTRWPGESIVIVDPEQLGELSTGRIGEVWVAGPQVSEGYWQNPALTAESFGHCLPGHAEPYLRTGDLGFLDDAGRLYVTGRLKEVIVVRGKNHYPQDLEDTAQTCVPGLVSHRGAVFTLNDHGADPCIVLVQEVKRNVQSSEYPGLAARIRENVLAAHGIALHEVVLVRIGAIPVTSSGKIQRLRCRTLLSQESPLVLHRSADSGSSSAKLESTAVATAAPPGTDAIVEKLVELIRQHGPRKDAHVDAAGNFSQYGLDSVTLVALLADLGNWLGREVEATSIWEFPSLGQLAVHLAEPNAPAAAPRANCPPGPELSAPTASALKFSLLFFASEDLQDDSDRYELLIEASRFADQNGFHAVWVPERHFHAFGGLYPSPSVLASALARETEHVRLRSGSVVLPLNNPVRVAEEWALIDNLSRGRVDLGFAQGWNANDFVLAPTAYEDRKEVMFQGVETIRRLWRGEQVELPNGRNETVPIRIHPAPLQKELTVWITCSGADERFVEAGRAGCNVLTALLFQPMEELFRKIQLYREARATAGHEGPGIVTVMLHTYLHPDPTHVKQTTKGPFVRYLETSTSLWRQESDALKGLSEAEREKALEVAYERYVRTTSLIGTPAFASEVCQRLSQNGVNEIACLIDFGLPLEEAMSSLWHVATLAGQRGAVGKPGKASRSELAPVRPTFEPIAVIGVAAKAPGADTARDLWENLKRGVDSVGPMPSGRWPGQGNELAPTATSANFSQAGWFSRVDLFDAEFFRISPAEAALMDPQQRLFLEAAWRCIQDAGYSGPDLEGESVGVYVGAADSRYEAHFRWNQVEPDAHMLAGNTICTLPARLSYYLDLRGPCLAIDTACSSSLVAIHEACRALQAGECEAAIAGGVSLLLTPDLFQVAGKAGMLSSRGQCRAFDANADGYVPGEGVGAVFLKPLSAAVRDGDAIYGVIRGSAVNHDGRTNGITAPNPKAQIEVAREALRQADLTATSIGYVECHGTGTHLGDPIEFRALQEVYGNRTEPLAIGSIKSNIGHLLAAAGIASFLKALFSLEHRLLVPSLHFEQPNPNLSYGVAPLRVVTEVAAWESESPRRAAVSGYGHSGTNCTMILEEFVAETPPQSALPEPCVVSGRDEHELREVLEQLSAHLLRDRNATIASVARSLALGRTAYRCRAAFVATSATELAMAIRYALTLEGPAREVAFASGEALLQARTDARAGAALAAFSTFLAGGKPDWAEALPTGSRCHLPAYPLHPSSHWAKPSNGGVAAEALAEVRLDDPDEVSRDLRSMMARLLECDTEAVDPAARFLDLGADSIILMDAVTYLQSRYGLKLPMGEFFETVETLDSLKSRVLKHLAENRLQRSVSSVVEELSAAPTGAHGRSAQVGTLPAWASASASLDEIDPAFARAYCERTARSKRLTQEARAVLADNRASAGFRVPAKELVYPLLAEHGEGAHLEDVDGNRYVDITMGFGLHLFGHNPPFIRSALAKAVERGFVLGPQSPLAGDVARRIARLTGHARVAFCNSGTEAVMSALRLARNFTSKRRVALFSHSYHGHSDGVLAYPDESKSLPAVPGVPESAVAATTVLPYGESACFETLDALHGDLAAVLVEPVQARNPGHQPFEFLARLREWTRKRGVVLIFDEMITGFRIAAGGVQEVLGFRADLATYGKIVGGGLPIGVVAGEAAILDGIDGGCWSYGDTSAPTAPTTFFAGTFSKHPLALEAARAALEKMESTGKDFYPRLNATSDDACRRLNQALREAGYPGEVRNFGSLFRFFLKGRQDSFFYRLVMNGIYVWEGRNCFLSTEHGAAEVDALVAAVRDSARAERISVHDRPEAPAGFPTLDSQRQLWALAQIDTSRFFAYNECHALRLARPVDTEALRAACAFVLRRHELLHSRLSPDGTRWLPYEEVEVPFSVREIRDDDDARAHIRAAKRRPFELERGLLWSVALLRLPDGTGYVLVDFHHLVVDGWSFAVLLEEIASAYNAHRAGTELEQAPVVPFSRFVAHQRDWLASPGGTSDAAFWRDSLTGYAPGRGGSLSAVTASTISESLSPTTWNGLKASARRLGSTLSSLLLSAYLPLLWDWRGQDDVVVAVPVSARTFAGSSRIVGYCAHVMPLRFQPEASGTVLGLVTQTQHLVSGGLSRQNYPFSNILADYRKAGGASPESLAALGFNLDRNLNAPELDGMRPEIWDSPVSASDFELNLALLEHDAGAKLSLHHRLEAMDEKKAARWVGRYLAMLSAISTADPATPWRDLAVVTGVVHRPPERRAEATFAFE